MSTPRTTAGGAQCTSPHLQPTPGHAARPGAQRAGVDGRDPRDGVPAPAVPADMAAIPGAVKATRAGAEFTPYQDRAMLEWSRQRPDDGVVIGATFRLRGPKPTAGQVAALVTARLPQLPALAEYLDGPVGAETWRPDSAFDPARHVHILDQAADLTSSAQMLANQPVWEDRPRWGLWIADTERDGEYLLAYRVHHAAQDGIAAAYTLKHIFDARAAAVPSNGPRYGTSPAAGAPASCDSRLLATAEAPLEAMRAISRSTGASLHDIYLTALAGALRAWLPPTERDQPAPVRVPFSVRLRHERQDRGNRVGNTLLLLPVDEPQPAHRLTRMVRQTADWPRERTRRLLDRMPHHLLWNHIAAFLSPGDSLASATLLSLPMPLAFNGSPVTAGISTPPLAAGHLFASVLFRHPAGATLSLTAQKQHQHVRDLPRLWQRAVTELAAATCP